MASTGNTAKLILQLIDRVSKPAAVIQGSLRGVGQAASTMATVVNAPSRALGTMGRSLTRNTQQLSMASGMLAIGLGTAGKAVYDFEKIGNRMQAFGLLTDENRQNLENYAKALNKDFPFSNAKILEAATELFRAGLTYEQAMGALRGTLNLAMAGDIDVGRATDIATNVMTAMKLPMETFEQVQASLLKVNDALAYAASNSNTDVQQMGDTFRYVAPLAAAAGMSIEEVTAVSMALARAGIKGSEAGVALRSSLVRMAKPTKPMLAAFERLGISMKDFVKYRDKIEAKSIIGSLLADGIEADGLSGEIQAILDDPALASAPARMAARLTDLIVGAFGDETLRDKVSENMQDAVLAGAQDVDLIKLLDVLKQKGATITDIAAIFDARMGSRLASIIGEDLLGMIKQVQKEASGTAERTAGLMVKGIVGDTLSLRAALENLSIAVGDSGVLGTVSRVFDKISEFVNRLSAMNPKILEFATYGLMATAAIAPLGFALAGAAAGLAVLANPLTVVAGSLIGLSVLKWDGIKSGLQAFRFGLKSTLSPQVVAGMQSVVDRFKSLQQWASSAPNTSKWIEFGRSFGVSVGNMANSLRDAVPLLKPFVTNMVDLGKTFVSGRWEALQDIGQSLSDFGSKLASNGGVDAMVKFASSLGDIALALGSTALKGVDIITKSLVAFGKQFLGAISPEAITSVSNGLEQLAGWFSSIAGSLASWSPDIDGAAKSFGQIGKVAGQVVNDIVSLISNLPGQIGGLAGDLYQAGADAMQGLWDGMMSKVDALLAWASSIRDRIKSALTGGGWNLPGEPSKQVGKVRGHPTGKATGGAVRRGLTYEINERGRETVTMGTNGYVTPAHKVGGATITNTFHINGSDGEKIGRQIVKALEHQLNRAHNIALDGRRIR